MSKLYLFLARGLPIWEFPFWKMAGCRRSELVREKRIFTFGVGYLPKSQSSVLKFSFPKDRLCVKQTVIMDAICTGFLYVYLRSLPLALPTRASGTGFHGRGGRTTMHTKANPRARCSSYSSFRTGHPGLAFGINTVLLFLKVLYKKYHALEHSNMKSIPSGHPWMQKHSHCFT